MRRDKVDSKPLLARLNISKKQYLSAGLRSRQESEVFEWSRSRISNNTGSRSRIFLSDLTPDAQLDCFLHHTPKLGIPVELEMVQFLLKLLLKKSPLAVHHNFH